MRREEFRFDLPAELIAQEPRPRGTSRLLLMESAPDGSPLFLHRTIADFPRSLRPGDVVVVNDTRVIPARLFAAPKPSMQRPIEILLTRPLENLTWECWARPAKRLSPGDELRFSEELGATILSRSDSVFTLRFSIEGGETRFRQELERIGQMPLPPYIRRAEARSEDREQYQTVFARNPGAIAAPTAGLHFTPEILQGVREAGAEIVAVTLHVGVGTFAPVKVDDIADHRMHSETYELTAEAAASLNAARREGRRIVAIGTTSVRTLESALQADGTFVEGRNETSIFITPGYSFRSVDLLLTNFHLPESTLLMLVSAFAGVDNIRALYREAIEQQYRFFSYGDAVLLQKIES